MGLFGKFGSHFDEVCFGLGSAQRPEYMSWSTEMPTHDLGAYLSDELGHYFLSYWILPFHFPRAASPSRSNPLFADQPKHPIFRIRHWIEAEKLENCGPVLDGGRFRLHWIGTSGLDSNAIN